MSDNDLIRRGDALALPYRLSPSLDASDGYYVSVDAIRALAASFPADPVTNAGCFQPVRVKHVKRGSTYRVIGAGKVQTGTPLHDYDEVVIYQDEADGRLWVRPTAEFGDGRFEPLEPADYVTNAGCRQQMKAKPLVWEHGRNRLQMDSTMMMGKGYDFDTMELTRQEGYGFGCGYIIWAIRSGLGKKSWNVYGTLDGIFIQDIASEDAAKDAAQADYEAMILSAIEPAPVTPAEAAKVLLSNRAAIAAMVDAAEEAHEKGVSFDVVIGRALRAVGRDEANG